MQGPPPSERGKLEHLPKLAELGDSDGIRRPQDDGKAAERGWMTSGPFILDNRLPVLEHGPCRHPLASRLVSGMDLEAIRQVECAAGCGHRLYSDRGPVECPCHWRPAVAAGVARRLCQVSPVRFSA